MTLQTGPDDALLIVDVQNDFLPGGALGVSGGDEIIAVLNAMIDRFQYLGQPVIASRDWHPPHHCSFIEQGGIWPPHCVANTAGARFASSLQLPASTFIVSKATTEDKDAYSAFDNTGLHEHLQKAGCEHLFVGGLATDYCVLNTVLDALKYHYRVTVLQDAIRAVNIQPDDGSRAIRKMREAGARFIDTHTTENSVNA